MITDLSMCMAILRPGENVSPDMSSYQAMADHWRGSGDCPALAEVEAAQVSVDTILAQEAKANAVKENISDLCLVSGTVFIALKDAGALDPSGFSQDVKNAWGRLKASIENLEG